MKTIVLLFTAVTACFAQLTADQKRADMRMLVDVFAKNYAPYEWKKTAVKFDALKIGPWLDRAAATKTDLEFYDVCIEYVSSLFDAHDYLRLPSTFNASVGFTLDIYDGKVLIDSIDELRLPPDQFPAKVGDELVSFDGKSAADWLKDNAKYAYGGNTSSNRRDAAGLITSRSQVIMPFAHKIGDEAEVVFKNEAGETKTAKVLWRKRGTPVELLAWPFTVSNSAAQPRAAQELVDYREILKAKQNLMVDTEGRAMVRGIAVKEPIFALPEGFTATVGTGRFDTVYGGVITFEEKKIGFLRIAQFAGASGTRLFRDALAAMKETTDAIVIDVTRNPGGSAYQVEDMAAELMTADWKVQGSEQITSWRQILALQSGIESARLFGDEEAARFLEFDLDHYQRAYKEGKGKTGPVPFCQINETRKPLERAYPKPVLVLIDEFSTSASEHFAALLQDNGRAKLFGKRTTGAGGAVRTTSTGIYSEAQVSFTWTLTNRTKTIKTDDYPE
ncbi:MAG: hypothetical protein FJW32_13915, partial [Acidobacteria bacterium]|nr:hypothetical protein [Acidobacteriota bacterium]